ncbi:hypothetical protein FV241_20010 [Methylobacterium sp. WL2]|nr:hypothetical protein FVA80_24775 [Methylobacterium sp. WL1]TXN55416.1 hypothetical protein FV241_20010 [Methylobacterium sp. WL2]
MTRPTPTSPDPAPCRRGNYVSSTLDIPDASGGCQIGDDVAAILLTLKAKNAELRKQLAMAQNMLMETVIDAGNLHDRQARFQSISPTACRRSRSTRCRRLHVRLR